MRAGPDSSPWCPWQDKRQWGQDETHEVLFKYEKTPFHYRRAQILAQVAQRHCVVSDLGCMQIHLDIALHNLLWALSKGGTGQSPQALATISHVMVL